MARTKRKVNPVLPPVAVEAPTRKTYQAAAYTRLSIKDGGKPGADTLATQQELLRAFISDQPDMQLVRIYSDNGQTGTNFERPGFEQLLTDVRAGKINCIVVKDLSRFGRNYKETGNYLQRIFPLLGIRFVAITDNFDTETAEKNEYGFIIPLKNIMNDTYSRDISRKVSSAIATKELHGEFVGAYAPYGYRKSAQNRHLLEVNPETAPVVQEIFALRMQGMGYVGIMRLLNGRDIPSPGAYLYRCGLTTKEACQDALWTVWNIKEILRNEVYLGHLVQGKRTQAYYKQARKERYAPAAEWRVSRNTHEALVDADTFAAVQQLAENSKRVYEAALGKADDLKTPNLFRGLLYCADCGKPLLRRHIYSRTRRGRSYYYSYLCPKYLQKAGACTPKNLLERELLTVVSDVLRNHIDAVETLETYVAEVWDKKTSAMWNALSQDVTAAEGEVSRYKTLLDGLYPSLVSGVISRQEYGALKERYQTCHGEAVTRLEELKAKQKEMERCGPSNPMFAAAHMFDDAGELSEELIHALIAWIEVRDGNLLDIKLMYGDEYAKLTCFVEGARAS